MKSPLLAMAAVVVWSGGVAADAARLPGVAAGSAAQASTATSAPSSPSVVADQVVVIIEPSISPPPPPLSTVVDTWAPLYFFIGLVVAWAIVMLAVVGSFYVRIGTPAETTPLQQGIASQFARPASQMGKSAWADVDPAMVQQYMLIDGWTRAAFIRKVYAILSTQLLVSCGVVVGLIYAGFVHGDPNYPSDFGYYIIGPGYYLSLVTMIITLYLLCALMSCKKNYPINFIGLGLFTLGISFSIALLCMVYYAEGFGAELLLAFVITCATFLVLTVFTIVSKIDFSFLAPFLCVGIVILVIWSLIMSLFFAFGGYSASWELVFVIFGMAIFVGFIVYDTYMIVTRLGVDEYIVAAIELYLDVINLFIFVLQCLVLTGRR